MPCEQAKKRIDNVVDQRAYDGGEGRTDDHTDGKIHHIAPESEFFKFFQKFFHDFLLVFYFHPSVRDYSCAGFKMIRSDILIVSQDLRKRDDIFSRMCYDNS